MSSAKRGAVEMLIGMIHNNEHGISGLPRATLVGSSWMEGSTVLKKIVDRIVARELRLDGHSHDCAFRPNCL